MKITAKATLPWLVTASLLIIDRAAKNFFRLNQQEEVFVLGNWLKLKLAYNSGVAFSLPANHYLVITVSALIIVWLVWFLVKEIKKHNLWRQLYWLMITFGAMSNLYDRLTFGQVIDYISFRYFSILNLADIMICLGVVGVILTTKTRRSQGVDKELAS